MSIKSEQAAEAKEAKAEAAEEAKEARAEAVEAEAEAEARKVAREAKEAEEAKAKEAAKEAAEAAEAKAAAAAKAPRLIEVQLLRRYCPFHLVAEDGTVSSNSAEIKTIYEPGTRRLHADDATHVLKASGVAMPTHETFKGL